MFPSSTSSAASGCANLRMSMAAPGLSFPTRPAQTLSTVPNQGCCSLVLGQNADNVAVGRQLLDRINPSELQSLFSELAGRLNVPRPEQFNPGRLGESPPAPNVPAFVGLKGICSFQVCLIRATEAMKIGMSSAAVRSGWVHHHLFLTIRLGREGIRSSWSEHLRPAYIADEVAARVCKGLYPSSFSRRDVCVLPDVSTFQERKRAQASALAQ